MHDEDVEVGTFCQVGHPAHKPSVHTFRAAEKLATVSLHPQLLSDLKGAQQQLAQQQQPQPQPQQRRQRRRRRMQKFLPRHGGITTARPVKGTSIGQ